MRGRMAGNFRGFGLSKSIKAVNNGKILAEVVGAPLVKKKQCKKASRGCYMFKKACIIGATGGKVVYLLRPRLDQRLGNVPGTRSRIRKCDTTCHPLAEKEKQS